MRWCRFRVGEKVSFGIVEGDEVIQVSGSPFETYRRTRVRYPLSQVKLLTPCIPPIAYATHGNYWDHIEWVARTLHGGATPQMPEKPGVGYRATSALIAHEENIVIPKDSSIVVDYEGELTVVIGKKAHNLSREEALSCVLGYTCINDISVRTLSKKTDTSMPMGPWIETDVDPNNLDAIVRINGKVVSKGNTGKMIFDVATYLSEISRYLTLYPGDILLTGTPGPTSRIRPGDVVEVEFSGVGVLRNPVVAEK